MDRQQPSTALDVCQLAGRVISRKVTRHSGWSKHAGSHKGTHREGHQLEECHNKAFDKPDLMKRNALFGCAAGFLGTVAMTIAMEFMYRCLPPSERYPLPPRQITMAIAEKGRTTRRLDECSRLALTLALHFGYGSAVGALYQPFAARLPIPVLFKGMSFGMTVWAVSYLGWVPILGLLPSATEQPIRRTGLMIAAHLVWGSVIAIIVKRLPQERRAKPRQ